MSATALAQGIHEMDSERYHSDPNGTPSLTASIAHLLVNSSPLHAWTAHPKLNPHFEREEKTAYDLGTIAHSLILEADAAKVKVIEEANWMRKAAKEARDAARAAGFVPILEKDWDRVLEMVAAIRSQLDARPEEPPLFTDGKPERTLVWQERGVTCRARLDWLRDDFSAVDDLKTTARSANPLQWARNTLWSIGADIQVAFYLRGVRKVTGVDAQFRYVLAETTPPYAISVVSLAASGLEFGQAKVQRAIDAWRECLSTGEWPGYPPSTYFAETPAWEELRWLEQDGEAFAS